MFSEMVDSCVSRSGRVDRILDIIDYCNSTIRECQTKALFHRDLVEYLLPATAEPTVWTFPMEFRQIRAVQYPDGQYPDFRQPSKIQTARNLYYYAAAGYMVFVGPGTDGQNIKMAYYAYLRRLKYYAKALRPAVFDEENQTWTYNPPITPSDPVAEAAAQAKVTNWLLLNHNELVKEGTLAKLFKAVKDQERSIMSYSLYKSMQEDLLKNEAFEALDK